jgi:hypothetical protein
VIGERPPLNEKRRLFPAPALSQLPAENCDPVVAVRSNLHEQPFLRPATDVIIRKLRTEGRVPDTLYSHLTSHLSDGLTGSVGIRIGGSTDRRCLACSHRPIAVETGDVGLEPWIRKQGRSQ